MNETIVLQKISSQSQNMILESPALTKFWSFVLSQTQHFDSDTIGFALVAKLNRETWVINEVQTDVINRFRKITNINNQRQERIDVETLKDMLEANNRKNWIPYIESNQQFRESILQNPNQIYSLCEDNIDIKTWLQEQGGGQMANIGLLAGNISGKKIFMIG